MKAHLSPLLLALAYAGAPLARPAELPPALADTLPETHLAIAAIDADPGVRRAQGEREAAIARASGRHRGGHEWIAGGQWLDRDAGDQGKFNEWEVSLQRELRLPGKATVDLRIADAEQSVGDDLLADARHVAAISLLEAWLEWLAAEELRRVATQAVADAETDLDAIAARAREGDAALAEHDAALAAVAATRREERLAEIRALEARITLQARYPALPLPADAAPVAVPSMPEPGWRHWGERIIAVSHEVTLAEGRAELEANRAERARLDRRANPTFGVRALSERGGDETAVGVFFSMPLGTGARSAMAAEAAGQAIAAEADADAVRIEVGRHAKALAARAETLVAAWTLAKEGLDAQRNETSRLARGREIGGVALAPLLAARRREREAALAEVESRAAAYGAIARLLLDAHDFWINDDGHSTAGNATIAAQ
ncbi:MAG: TolC family protein [Arenimonas sp.]|uniref:TolC family protein n=1 Tax=Arenimonas sp. TaxID=1872635 RepID=UPI0025C08450|nr:TolC family protein [Arenimonas sp.]MBW8368391.1 TolC family protein [Arenimonas sp.]